jgi:hypothetical protein
MVIAAPANDLAVWVARLGSADPANILLLLQISVSRDNATPCRNAFPTPPEFQLSPQKKRRRFALYKSLPLVVAIVLVIVAKMAALQRADIIARLTDQIDQGSTPEATAAVRQLGTMPYPPIGSLVAAAANNDHEIADEAQLAISRLLRRCQRNLETKRRVRLVARQLDELAELLHANMDEFSQQDHDWLATTARKILELANRCSVGQTPLVAVHCDAIIETMSTNKSAEVTAAEGDLPAKPPAIQKNGTTTEDQNSSSARHTRLNQEFDAYANQQQNTHYVNDNSNQNAGGDTQSEMAPITATTDNRQNDATLDNAASQDAPSDVPERESPSSRPVFRILPAAPLKPTLVVPQVAPAPGSNTLRIADARAATREAAGVTSRELIKCWLEAQGFEASALKEELAVRGFSSLPRELAQRLASHDARERLQLVDDVLATPDVSARPWLTMLADDSDADVRLAAVSIMATSSDPDLIEKAWQTAIRDRDPRIADLAGKLRDRRENIGRR